MVGESVFDVIFQALTPATGARSLRLHCLTIRPIELGVPLIRETIVVLWQCLIIFLGHSTCPKANTCVCSPQSGVDEPLVASLSLSVRDTYSLLFVEASSLSFLRRSPMMMDVQLTSSVLIVRVCFINAGE